MKGENEMKILLSKGSIAEIALLMLLSLNAFAHMIVLVNAAAIRDNTLFVNGSGSVELTWKSGKSETYNSNASVSFGGLATLAFIPTIGWHIDAVLIDGSPVLGIGDEYDEDGFSLIDVRVRKEVSVTFAENGGVDDVDVGSNRPAYPDPDVRLIFVYVEAEGFAYATTVDLTQPVVEAWEVTTDAIFTPGITVTIVLSFDELDGADPYALTLFKTEPELTLVDVNGDGIVNGDDVSDVANANPSEPGDPIYDARLNMDDNPVINDDDVNIVNNYIGESVWEPLESWAIVDEVNRLVKVYGVTDDLCILGIR